METCINGFEKKSGPNFIFISLLHVSQEKDARDIEIPNIRWEVFELMMRLHSFHNTQFL